MAASPTMIFSSPSMSMTRNLNGTMIRSFKPMPNRPSSILSRDTSEFIERIRRQGANNRSRSEKSNKGLRHFSQKVMEKVKSQGKTTYNEVADDLVSEFGSKTSDTDAQSYDHKNIRRRVYDALNVLMAMNIIHKEKKEISWVGFPNNSAHECQVLEARRDELLVSVRQRLKHLKDLLLQQVSITNIMEENATNDQSKMQYKIDLPFAVITTPIDSNVECSVTVQKDEYLFAFEAPFEVYDEAALIKAVGANRGTEGNRLSKLDLIKCKKVLPKAMHAYAEVLASSPEENFEDYILNNRHQFIQQLCDTQQNQAASPEPEHLFMCKSNENIVSSINQNDQDNEPHETKGVLPDEILLHSPDMKPHLESL
ncbi:Transcription factor Dp-1 [Thelohanellus kitauei]|uniref:Transcription factor Dp-1 n=1 Tax=Thelohanellus kitauei TaxID=669202 RepID=A0A0C2N0W4_THEKT|nr:Transcription factor Dp-1 [Thelohanellus kitauei]